MYLLLYIYYFALNALECGTENLCTHISAMDVAGYFLQKANNDGNLITNLKMQKLLYYAQAWYLVNFDAPLFKEDIDAWNLGPVVRDAYNTFKMYRASPIKYEAAEHEFIVFTEEQKDYLDEFYDAFCKFSAHELVNMSHNEPPWENASQNKSDNIISHESMKKYYSSLVESGKKE